MTRDQLVYALILAGGKSARMGRDKGLVAFDGVPMLQRVGEVAQVSTDRVFILTPWCERYKNIVAPNWQFILESEPGGGALLGMKQGLTYFKELPLKPPWVLLLACDMPCLDSRVLLSWRSRLEHLDRSCLALVPKTEKGWEPLCGFYRLECLNFLEESQTLSFQEWLPKIYAKKIDLDQPAQAMLKNCNTPDDLVS